MTNKRIITLLGIAAIVAVVIAAPWRIAARPDTGPRCKPNGVYIEFHPGEEGEGEVYTQLIVPGDPSGNVLSGRTIFANGDATLGGMMDADSITDFVGNIVRTGKNTYEFSSIGYGTKQQLGNMVGKIVWIGVFSGEARYMDDCNIAEWAGMFGIFGEHQDKDADGIPDEDEKPFFSVPFTSYAKRMPMIPASQLELP